MTKIKTYIKSILVPVILGAIVGLIISSSMNYEVLQKPKFAPPGIVFPIVWTILYILMGISFGILTVNSKLDSKSKTIYFLQLVVNLVWPIIFFGLKLRLLALWWLILLIILVILMFIVFLKREKIAGLIQLPYIFWNFFALYLNFLFYLLNK